MGGDDFPDKIQVWRSTATLEYCGTWSTTRYPEDAVTYRRALPAASAEDVRAGALAEACGKLHDLMCLPDGADLAIAKRWAAESRALIQEAKP